ncbi:hypothetical protein D3874_22905 [Oleomonas cavernae]|uniref:AlgX/AlgJ SGNH hydrolase-like domain-containing protein n=1 Tax=Oleomonas cavernae TaxID=2320859 RepID=A0A418WHU4_9PROT|nr:tetratricopeptide repeat protein [Oleomonas cavernae]RJF89469.1 hypothetical protein D3874_22905 [Oleomonas cavernae]
MTDDLEGGQITAFEGKRGWLFLGTFDGFDAMSLYTDETTVPDRVFARWARAFERRRRWFDQRGIALVTLIVPEACLVYADLLPDAIRLTQATPMRRLSERLDKAAATDVIYPLQALIDGRAERETFQQVDSHWTDWGAYLGYRAVMEAVRRHLPAARLIEPKDVTWRQRKTFGALGAIMTPERSCKVPVASLTRPRAKEISEMATEQRHKLTTVVNPAGGPTAIVFRDSFATAMAPFLSESFGRTIYVSSPNTIYYDLIEQVKPDVVIFERTERALANPPIEPDLQDARAHFADLELGNDNALLAQRQSRAFLRAGKAKDAKDMSDRALDLAEPKAPGLGRALLHRARIFRALGNDDAAAECLRHAIALEPDAAMPVMLAGELDRARGRMEPALALLRRSTALEPGVPKYWEALGGALLEGEDAAGAQACFERALTLDPDRIEAHLLMSKVRRGQGDLAGARRHAELAVEIDASSSFTVSNLASVMIAQEDWAAARDLLAAAVPRFPQAPAFKSYLALCETRLGERAKAHAKTGS